MPASRVDGFTFASDATYTDAQACTVDYPNDRVAVGPFLCPLPGLLGLRDACRELLDQPTDNILDTEKKVKVGGVVVATVELADDGSTLALVPAPHMPVAKIEGFLSGLTDHGLL